MLRRILAPLGTIAVLAPLYIFIVDPYPMSEEVFGISRDLWLLAGFAAVFLWVTGFSFTAASGAPAKPQASVSAPAPPSAPTEKKKSKSVALPPSPPAKILSEAAWAADTDQASKSKAAVAFAPASTPAPASSPDAPALASSPFDSPGMTMMMPSVIPAPTQPPLPAPAAATTTAPVTLLESPLDSFASAPPLAPPFSAPDRALPSIDDAAGKTLLGLRLDDVTAGAPGPSRPLPAPSPEGDAVAAPAPRATTRAPQNDYDALYREFARLRAENHEPPAPPRERFIDSLNARRDSIRRESGVDDVRFEVYSKAGRATLRATPIRNTR